jgi:hypothetical protein
MRFFLVLPALALACGSSSPKPAAPVAAAPAPAPEPAPAPAPAPPAAPALPPLPEAPPPAAPSAAKPYVAKALAYLPPDTQVLIGIDVPRIAGTPLGAKLRGALLGAKLPAPCAALSPALFGNIVLGRNGGEKFVAVVDGKLGERTAIACVEAGIGQKGGKLERKTLGGRKVYYVTGSAKDNGWVTWTKTGAVMASSEAALSEALDPKSVKLGGELAALTAKVDHARMVWGAAIVQASALQAMGVPLSGVTGSISVRAGIELAAETDLDIVLGFPSPGAATATADTLKAMIAPLRSQPNVAPLLSGLSLGVYGSDIHLVARLDAAVTSKLIEAIDVK